jgi:hypothetical protein
MQTTHLEHGKAAAADFDPANYQYVSTGYNGESDDNIDMVYGTRDIDQAVIALEDEARRQTPYSGLNRRFCGGKCQHCGKHLKWFNMYRDVRTGLLLITGLTCAEELDLPDKGALVRKAMAERIERSRKLAKIDARFPGLRLELERVVGECNRAYFQTFLLDVCHKMNHYLDLSDKQAATIKRLLAKGLDTIEQRAREAAERKSAPAPSGRVVVTGKILTVKEYEVEGFGYHSGTTTIYKILVEDDRGFRCFGSQPSAIGNSQRGDRVTFRATLEPKVEDPTFAFFKRPSNAAYLEENA